MEHLRILETILDLVIQGWRERLTTRFAQCCVGGRGKRFSNYTLQSYLNYVQLEQLSVLNPTILNNLIHETIIVSVPHDFNHPLFNTCQPFVNHHHLHSIKSSQKPTYALDSRTCGSRPSNRISIMFSFFEHNSSELTSYEKSAL